MLEMEKKQTAVEYYSKQHLKLLVKLERKELSLGEYVVAHQLLLEQSKQLEKQQIVDGVYAGYNYDGARLEEYSEQYYTKTYESPQRDRSGKA